MSKYQQFKHKYIKIRGTYPSAFNPEPWLDYLDLVEEMLETIKSQEETIERWKRDGIPSSEVIEEG